MCMDEHVCAFAVRFLVACAASILSSTIQVEVNQSWTGHLSLQYTVRYHCRTRGMRLYLRYCPLRLLGASSIVPSPKTGRKEKLEKKKPSEQRHYCRT